MSADLVVLVGNPRPGSRTRTLAELVARELAGVLEGLGDVSVLELAEIVGVSFGSEPARGGWPAGDAFAEVRAARVLVVATPTYKGTYTGLLKVFLDQYGAGALAGTVAVPVAVAAAPRHRRSVAAALTDLLSELGAAVPAPAVALLEADLAEARSLVSAWVAEHRGTLGRALCDARAAVAATSLTESA
jgi:FMN reductase